MRFKQTAYEYSTRRGVTGYRDPSLPKPKREGVRGGGGGHNHVVQLLFVR